MSNRRRLLSFAFACLSVLVPAVAHAAAAAPPVQRTDTATFANTNVGSTISGCTGCTDTETITIKLNQQMILASIAIPQSANGHAEFSVGTITGCVADNTTNNSAGTVCTIPVTFSPYYPGLHNYPLVFTTSTGQVYSIALQGLAIGAQQHIEPDSESTVVGMANTVTTSPQLDNNLATAANLKSPTGIWVDAQDNYLIAQGLYTDGSQNPAVRVVYNAANPALACLIVTENPSLFGNPASGCVGATSQPQIGYIYALAGTLTAGVTTAGTGASNVLATTSALSGVMHAVADAYWDVFFTEQNNNRVRVIYNGGPLAACLIELANTSTFGVTGNDCTTATSLPAMGYVYTIAGTGTSANNDTPGLAINTTVKLPLAITLDPAGDIFFTTASISNGTSTASQVASGRVKVLYAGGANAAAVIAATNSGVTTPTIGYLYTIGGNATPVVEGGDSTLATSATVGILNSNGIAVDTDGNIYFSDATNGTSTPLATAKVRMIYKGGTNATNVLHLEYPAVTPAVGYVYEIAGTTTGIARASQSNAEGQLANTQPLTSPHGISLDAAGNILIVERAGYIIRRLLVSNATMNTVFGMATQTTTTGTAYPFVTGTNKTTSTAAGDDGGDDVITALDGSFYETQQVGNRIHRISYSTGTIGFADSVAGTLGTAYPVMFVNVGNGADAITSITMPTDFVISSTATNASVAGMSQCVVNASIPAGSACFIPVAPFPTTSGSLSETMTIKDKSLGSANVTHTVTLTTTASGTAVALSTNPPAITAGNPTTIQAIVNASGVTVPNGLNVNFTSGSNTLGTSQISDQVLASINVTNGGSGYTTPPTVTISGGGGSGATATAVLNGDAIGSITINNFGTGFTGTPTVAFAGGGGSSATATAAIGGLATLTSSTIFVAPLTSITATFPAQSTFSAGSTTVVFPVSSKPATTTTIVASPTTINQNGTTNLTATVTSAISGTINGNVSFYDGTTLLGSANLNTLANPETATYVATLTTAGTHSMLTAKYNGDTNYDVSTSALPATVVVVAPSFSITPVSTAPIGTILVTPAGVTPVVYAIGVSTTQGSQAAVTFNIVSVGGYAHTVTPSCDLSAAPAGFGCIFSPSAAVFTGTNTTISESVIINTTTINTSSIRRAAPWLATLLLPGAGLALFGLRRRKKLAMLALLCAAFAASLGLSGCGKAISVTTSPKGTYQVNIQFTDGTTTYTFPVTVSVQSVPK